MFVISHFSWKNGCRINQYLFAVIITLPLFSFGMVQGWLSPMTSELMSPRGPAPEPYTSDDVSWMTSVTYISAIVTGVPMGHLTDKYGRRFMTLATTASLIVYWCIKLVSLRPWAVILARAVAGVPCSACYIVLPIYLKEISDVDLRGPLGSMLIMNRNIGYLVSYALAAAAPGALLALGAAVPALLLPPLLLAPETPEYLARSGRVQEAKAVLAWLRGAPAGDGAVAAEVDDLARGDRGQTRGGAWRTIWTDRATFRAFVVALVIKMTQQFDGYLMLLLYSGYALEEAGARAPAALSPRRQIIVVGAMQLLGSAVAMAVVERTGRKMLLVTTSLSMGAGMLCLAAWFVPGWLGWVPGWVPGWLPGWVPAVAMSLCIFSDAAGFQPVSYIIVTDLFNFQLRGTVSMFVNVCAKVSNFVQAKWFIQASELFGIQYTFLFFAVVCVAAGLYSALCVPETRGKTVDEIYSQLDSKRRKEEATA